MWPKANLSKSAHPRVAILHIPKTAGTSVLEVVKRNVRQADIHTHYPPDDVPSPPDAPLAAGVLIGHYFFGFERSFFAECDRAVFLREPEARLVSQLHYEERYFSRRPESPFCAWFRDGGRPVDFIERSRFWYLDNAAVRMVAGIGDTVAFGGLGDEHLEAAIANLDRFDFVGLQTTFPADLRALMKRYGWRGRVPRTNAAPREHALSGDERERLRPHNRLDEQLYERAVALKSEREG